MKGTCPNLPRHQLVQEGAEEGIAGGVFALVYGFARPGWNKRRPRAGIRGIWWIRRAFSRLVYL